MIIKKISHNNIERKENIEIEAHMTKNCFDIKLFLNNCLILTEHCRSLIDFKTHFDNTQLDTIGFIKGKL